MQRCTAYGHSGMRLLLVLGAVCSLILRATPVRDVRAQQQTDFNAASLSGTYALVGTGGAHETASIGIETYDGQGNMTRSLILNEPGPEQNRHIITITGEGIYSVQANGMGTTIIINTLPDGTTFFSHLDFVITQATTSSNGAKAATEVFAMLRETGIAAPLVTFVLRRLPD